MLSKFLQPLYFTTFDGSFTNINLKLLTTNLWQSLWPVSQTKVFWKIFGLLKSNTSRIASLLELKQVDDYTKFVRLYVSFRSKMWLFPSHFGSEMLIVFKFIYKMTLAAWYLFRNKFYFVFGIYMQILRTICFWK